ncbi:protein Njmu-R1 isoform X2 [Stegostoma tigrinum]|uniref:protein Njmu-R1 isoform X2 n=1 Tax=Stegostoma tigrinum TaxID=3053191 RepID=UPI00202AF5BD|nr:protein Njmu-R1 isoform X2 [Stegostoma tigrinum]XP_048411329.1 protein Njmu-R1 isoform X2 [Stegostoma tigrinum]
MHATVISSLDPFMSLLLLRSLQLGDEGGRRNESPETCSKDTVSQEDFSLSLLASNLSVVAESELRAFIAKRLSKGAVLSRMGTITAVDLSIAEQAVACYYCLVQPDQPPSPESNRPESKSVVTDYILCFLGSTEKSLELFRIELDKYAQGLQLHLDAEVGAVELHIQPYLSSWYEDAVLYIRRVLQLFQNRLAVLLRAALSHTPVEVKDSDNKIKQDVERFLSAASLQGLIQENMLASLCKVMTEEPQNVIIINCSEPTPAFQNAVSNKFCEDWIPSFLNSLESGNPFLIRQILENFKLKAIQDMNSLKRYIRQAETNNYALFKCFVFLKNCGNGDVLLQNVKVEHVEMPEAQNVVKVLEEFMYEEGVITPTN